jgi:hypothetical protein
MVGGQGGRTGGKEAGHSVIHLFELLIMIKKG